MKNDLLQIKNFNFSYLNSNLDRGKLVLKNLNFTLSSNISLGVIGPNGGGKSTLLKLLTGNLNPIKGSQIFFKGKKVKRLNPRSDFSYLAQENHFKFYFPVTVLDFLNQGLIGLINPSLQIEEVISIFKLTHLKNNLFEELSGGQKQKVLIARVFLRNTPLIFLDEPTLGLDGTANDQLLEMIKEINNKHNFGILIVDHHIDKLITHCQQILCLNQMGHWHSPSEKLDVNNVKNYYHCEYEHLLVHNQELESGELHHHDECKTDHNHSDLNFKGKKKGKLQ